MLDVFFDEAVPPGAVRLFVIIARRYSSGFYGRRETLATWSKMTRTTVDTYVAKLARLGYLKVQRRPNQPGIIRPVRAAVERSGIVTDLDAISRSDLDATSKSVTKDHEKPLPCYKQPVSNTVLNREGFAALVGIGIRDQEAAELSATWPTKKIQAAIIYAESKAESNQAGFVVRAIRDVWRIPSWCFAKIWAGGRESHASAKAPPVSKQPGPVDTLPEDWDLAVSGSDRQAWDGFLAQIKMRIQPTSFTAWFEDQTFLDGFDDLVLRVRTRTEEAADWIREHYASLIADVADAIMGKKYIVQVQALDGSRVHGETSDV